jgi:hypothetical protein
MSTSDAPTVPGPCRGYMETRGVVVGDRVDIYLEIEEVLNA